ncbi:hypothetical protein AB4Z25_18470 [Rhizobium sp. RAF36]|uniref:hypothetical protein n=1 Tax=Rhizobium sp. RAF36 TaxID=3233055 RepID=UPI003F9D55F5
MVGDEIRHARRDTNDLRGNETSENIEQKQCSTKFDVSPEIAGAALWFSRNSDEVRGNPLLELMARFELSIRDAVTASKLAHALRFPRAAE